jgi:hypothetical protein
MKPMQDTPQTGKTTVTRRGAIGLPALVAQIAE